MKPNFPISNALYYIGHPNQTCLLSRVYVFFNSKGHVIIHLLESSDSSDFSFYSFTWIYRHMGSLGLEFASCLKQGVRSCPSSSLCWGVPGPSPGATHLFRVKGQGMEEGRPSD